MDERCIIGGLKPSMGWGASKPRQVLTDHKVDAGTTSPNDFAIMVKAGGFLVGDLGYPSPLLVVREGFFFPNVFLVLESVAFLREVFLVTGCCEVEEKKVKHINVFLFYLYTCCN